MTDNQITQLLTYLLCLMIFVLVALIIVFIWVKVRDNKRKKEEMITNENAGISGMNNTATRGYNNSWNLIK